VSPGRPARPDDPTLHHLLEAARAHCPESLHRLCAEIISALQLHDERLTRIEETPEIRDLLP
jgi:hypothetical protein